MESIPIGSLETGSGKCAPRSSLTSLGLVITTVFFGREPHREIGSFSSRNML